MNLVRLKKRKDFLRVAASKRKWVTPGLVLQIADAETGQESGRIGVGFTASKKVGNAILRNRAKRRLREAVRATFPTLAVPGHDYVVIARHAACERPFDKLLADLEFALKRLK